MTTPPIYELRMYRVEQGRMHDMIARRQGPLKALFQKHGIEPLGDWHTTNEKGNPLFVYLMRWRDWNTRQEAWNGFYNDPTWWAERERTNAGSQLVERYALNILKEITPWVPSETNPTQTLELLLPTIDIGCSAAAAHQLQHAQTSSQSSAEGTHLRGAFEFMTGNDLPRAALFVSHPAATTAPETSANFLAAPLRSAERYRLTPISV